MKKTMKIVLLFAFLVLVAVLVYDAFFAKNVQSETAFLMGTVVNVDTEKRGRGNSEAPSGVIEKITQLENIISAKKQSAQLYQLNLAKGGVLSKELEEYIQRCSSISAITKGAFDITVGQLSSLWDFDNDTRQIPSQRDISSALKSVGYDNITIENGNALLQNDTRLDMGAAGKGLACEVAADYLKNVGVKNAVVTVGGSVGVLGKSVNVGIRNPFGKSTSSFAQITSGDCVISTSGVYEKSFKGSDNKLYHHILDPATGYPVESDLVSVSVLCQDGIASDALATACFKLGFDTSLSVLDSFNAMAVFVYSDYSVKVYNEIYPMKVTDSGFNYEK